MFLDLCPGPTAGVTRWLIIWCMVFASFAVRVDAQAVPQFRGLAGHGADQASRLPGFLHSEGDISLPPIPRGKGVSPTSGSGIDPSFNAAVTEGNGSVWETAVQPDGKILAVGVFHRANGVRVNGISRFHQDGTLDTGFVTGDGANSTIWTVALQPDGKILIGGDFTSFNGEATSRRIVRLHSNGSIDNSFAVNFGMSAVRAIAVEDDGRILIGGNSAIGHLVRVNSDGTEHTVFSGSFLGSVWTILVMPSGKIMTGGSIGSSSSPAAIRRYNSNGSLDSSFMPGTGPNSNVYRLLLQPDGKILASGSFTGCNGIATDGIVRLDDDGTIHTVFDHIASTSLNGLETRALGRQPDGRIVAGYNYNSDDSGDHAAVVRFNSDGTIDNEFVQADLEGFPPNNARILPDGKILIGGHFLEYHGHTRLRMAILNPDGSINDNFQAALSTIGVVRQIEVLPDNKILIGGSFGFVNGIRTKGGIARLHSDGSVDESFQTSFIAGASSLYVEPNGNILMGNGYVLMRLNPDGSVGDLTVDFQGFDYYTFIRAIGQQSDGKIVIAGSTFNFNAPGAFTCLRLNLDGTFDNSFMPLPVGGMTPHVLAMSIQPDDKIVLGGTFSHTTLFPRFGLARLNSDGTVADGFSGGAGWVYSFATQSNGNVIAGGLGMAQSVVRFIGEDGSVDPSFDIGSGANQVVRSVDVRPDGKIIVGGEFTSFNGNTANRVARLNSDGSFDSTFNVGTGTTGTVFAVAAQADGKVLVGGLFLDFDGTEQFSLIRIQDSATTELAPFDYDGDGRSDISVFRPSDGNWYLQQSTDGFYGVSFGAGTDRIVPADYDGDGKTDVAVYRPSTGIWYVVNSSDGTFSYHAFGIGEDLPAPADYDGEGKADVTVFRPSTGTWYRQNSSDGSFSIVQFGTDGDRPTIGDFDGDGKADIAVFRPSNGAWYQLNSSDGSFFGEQFGIATDKITPADYDGDGKTDIAIYRPSEGLWYYKNSATPGTYTPYVFGLAEDIPVPGDYDGDGKSDIAVFRPSNGHWYIANSSTGSFTIFQWGQNGDRPTPSAFGS